MVVKPNIKAIALIPIVNHLEGWISDLLIKCEIKKHRLTNTNTRIYRPRSKVEFAAKCSITSPQDSSLTRVEVLNCFCGSDY